MKYNKKNFSKEIESFTSRNLETAGKFINDKTKLLDRKVDHFFPGQITPFEIGIKDNCVIGEGIFRNYIRSDTAVYLGGKFPSYYLFMYDIIYAFQRFCVDNKINSCDSVIEKINVFLDEYFGNKINVNFDKMDDAFEFAIFTDIAAGCRGHTEVLEDLKNKNAVTAFERAIVAHQLLSFLGINNYLCYGARNIKNYYYYGTGENEGTQENYAFIIIEYDECCELIYFSSFVNVYDCNEFIKKVPFRGYISLEDMYNFVNYRGTISFEDYDLDINRIGKYYNGDIRYYSVGSLNINKNKVLSK